MHPNLAFRKATPVQNLQFAREISFGTLCVNADNGPLLSHIPFQINETATILEAHLVRSNPILALLDSQKDAVVSITGAHSYVSPDWYEADNQVPTWNYIAVHIRGKLARLPSSQLPALLQRLSDNLEQQLAPKPVWKMEKMDAHILEKMKKAIVPIAMEISEINGTWKLSQNKPQEVRLAAAAQMKDQGIGLLPDQIAALMADPPC